ncbi:hypothetical protein QT06_C0001G0986 [archaeon GW2011_AR15]|nr:hypothetical protein QT06_C0001G0986 [archaeon GW2011_AR15]
MLKMAKYSKLKMLLTMAFVFFLFMFITQIFGFFRTGFLTINARKDEFDCGSMNYEVINPQYTNNLLKFEFDSKNYNQNITSLTIVSDSGDIRTVVFEPVIIGKERRKAEVENITINEKYRFYINNCEELTYEKKI